MPRPKNNPSFDPAKLEAEVLKTVVELFNAPDNPNHDVSFIADELQISDLKARKLLITAGERDKRIYYTSPLAVQVQKLGITCLTPLNLYKRNNMYWRIL